MADQEDPLGQAATNVRALLSKYSPEDVAISLFVLNTWLPNIASQVKQLWVSLAFLSMRPEEFKQTSKIEDYAGFRSFAEALLGIVPEFPTVEDYVPEPDWGQIRYPLDDHRYRLLYGCELSNLYDRVDMFQLLLKPFDSQFQALTGRSPISELDMALALQDELISAITTQPEESQLQIKPGDFSVPLQEFWAEAGTFCRRMDEEELLTKEFLEAHSLRLGTLPTTSALHEGLDAALFGCGLPQFILSQGDRHFLLLPRRILVGLCDTWGLLLKTLEPKLSKDSAEQERKIAGSFLGYVRARFKKRDAFPFASTVVSEKKVHDLVFPVVFQSKDKLVLIYLLPPATDAAKTSERLDDLAPKFREAIECLRKAPPRLALRGSGELVEFRNPSQSATLEPCLLIVLPQLITETLPIGFNEELPGELLSLDSLLAILDELDECDMLADFLEYWKTASGLGMPGVLSALDHFGAFKDSHGVLLGGATTPNLVLLDPNWGSRFRYESLRRFWSLFPPGLSGEPRSWQVMKEGPRTIRLVGRTFFSTALVSTVGDTTAFITGPVDRMPREHALLANFLMECTEDYLSRFAELLKAHPALIGRRELVVIFFPRSLLTTPEFKHIAHLDPGKDIWRADVGVPQPGSLGVRIGFNEEVVSDTFREVQDRTHEVGLIRAILDQLATVRDDGSTKAMVAAIEASKNEKPRFMLFESTKPAAFPDGIQPLVPSPTHFKTARKRLAEIARLKGIAPGRYDFAQAKEKLHSLRSGLVGEIDRRIGALAFSRALLFLIQNADALTHNQERERLMIEGSLKHEVEYDRSARFSKSEHAYTSMHRNYRYLIEKLVQLQPVGQQDLREDELLHLLGIVDWLHVVQGASDAVHYEIAPTGLAIDEDFIPDVEFEPDSEAKQEEFSKDTAQVQLGLMGNHEDRHESPRSVQDRTNGLDEAFLKDVGFKFTSLVSTLSVLSHWPVHNEGAAERPFYSATKDEIEQVAARAIKDLNKAEVLPILDFLELRQAEVTSILKQAQPCADIPIWEHKKRPWRYTLRPLIRSEGNYFWGPHSARLAGKIWARTASTGMLPVDIGKAAIEEFLRQQKDLLDKAVETKTLEIVKRFTPHTRRGAKLHSLDRSGGHPTDLGDYDVLAYYPEAHAILNAECKNLQNVYCLKDAKTLRETIFGEPGKDEGHFRQIDRRQQYLSKSWPRIAQALSWPLASSEPPRVIPLYVTPMMYWWTKYPPRKVETTFVRLEMLGAMLQTLRAKGVSGGNPA